MTAEALVPRAGMDVSARRLLLVGMCMIYVVTCLDGTIISICGKQIMTDLDGMQFYSWLTASFLLTQTVLIPIAGKMSDQFGRKPVLYLGVAFFAVGSAMAAASFSPEMMIVSRAVQGIGGGMVSPVSNALVADVYPPEDRAKVMASINLLCMLSMVGGPFVGGVICAVTTWHWVFIINLPLVALFFALTARTFPEAAPEGNKTIDYMGMAALSAMILGSLFAFQFYSSMDLVQIAVIVLAVVVLLVMFIRIETRSAEPVMAPSLLRRKVVRLSSTFMFVNNLGLFGVVSFITLYGMFVYGLTEIDCAMLCIPMFVTMGVFTALNGAFLPKTGYRLWVVAGFLLMGAPLIFLYICGPDASLTVVAIVMAVFGAGCGALGSTISVSLQNHTAKNEMGMSLATVNLVRSVGSTLGAAVSAFVISFIMDSEMARSSFAYVSEETGFSGTGLLDLVSDTFEALYPGISEAVIGFFGDGFGVWSAVIGVAYLLLALLGMKMDKGYTVCEDGSRRRLSESVRNITALSNSSATFETVWSSYLSEE
ncbi:MAG: MFS transporter [Candidatus Methanomethylophilaceae archaeon]|nr:MFS transporter [Candidatus Methanomethylophilaceae archaeon]